MKKCWVLFMTKNFEIGSSEIYFSHFPPTATEIRYVQQELGKKYNASDCTILNWKELTEE